MWTKYQSHSLRIAVSLGKPVKDNRALVWIWDYQDSPAVQMLHSSVYMKSLFVPAPHPKGPPTPL